MPCRSLITPTLIFALGVATLLSPYARAKDKWVKKDHPYLFWDEDGLKDVKKKWDDKDFAAYRATILRAADDALGTKAGNNTDSNANTFSPLLFVYCMTGEKKYRDRLFAEVRAVSKTPVYKEGLHAMRAVWMGWVYDALHDELADEEKKILEEYLGKWVEAKVDNWFAKSPGNCCGVHLGGHGVAALALKDHPQSERRVASLAESLKRNFIGRAVREDGGWNEGAMYWDYGLTYYLFFAHALKNATGDDRGLLDPEPFEKMGDYVRTGLAGDGAFFSFNDSFPILTGGAIAADIGSRFDDPTLLWLADMCMQKKQLRKERITVWERNSFLPPMLIWRQAEKGYKDMPELPTLSVLPATQWGVMRSGPEWKPKLVVGVKGHKGELSHHKQHDMGTFELQAGGERFLFDPGYHMPEAEVHSVPLINGKGPEMTGATIVDSEEDRWGRSITMDCTPAWRGVERVRRVWAMYDDEAVVLLDDIEIRGGKEKVTMQLQCTWPPEIDNDKRIAVLQGKNTRLVIQFFGPEFELKSKPLDVSRNYEVYAKWAKEGRIRPHTLYGTYEAEEKNPLIVVFMPWPTDEKRPPKAELVERKGDTYIHFSRSKKLRFSQGSKGWECKGK